MSAWLLDTFVWTGAAMALVLLLRRPVARHFGPQVAYALWALPLARLLLPPFVLPARFAPQAIAETGSGAVQPVMVLVSDAAPVGSPAAVAPSFPWVEMAVVLWVAGALAFLVFRVHQYRAMRRDLLADGRPVGEAGHVRLVETPAVDAPVAFGVRDKVVALPPLFMAHPDIAARDLAIAHELAHHRGNDLLANMAAQLLLALHWFNPVAWAAWRAMRRDQEAACDARVVAGRARSERVAYASVIAGFATGQHLALAAPMACPVLGEKSIIHRLRTLTMSDVSAVRRKFGLAAIATTALVALPLTASISYAQPDEPATAPEAPAAPQRVIVIEHGPNAEGHDEGTTQRRVIIRHGADDTAMAEVEADHDAAQATADARRAIAEAEAAVAEGRAAAAEGRRRAVERTLADMPRFAMNCDGDSPVQQRLTEDGRQVTIICRRAITSGAVAGLREAQRAIREAEGLSPAQRDQIIEDLEQQIERMEGEEVAVSFSVPIVDHAAFAVAAVQPVVNVRWDAAPDAEAQTPMSPVPPVRVSAVYVMAKKRPVPWGSS
jgi:bla regulator protein BlaR1